MKQNGKQNAKNNRKTTQSPKRGKVYRFVAFLFAAVGVVSLSFAWGVSRGSVRLEENKPVALPTLAPTAAAPTEEPKPQPAVSRQTTPPPVSVAVETAAPVAAVKKTEPPRLELPLEGAVLVPFSDVKLIQSKTLGDWRTHSGVDIEAPTGSEVRAAAAGVVERAYCDRLMGHSVVIAHEGDCKTVYQNLASTEMVKEGERVEEGQCIAAVGDSAAAEMLEKPHLHFMVLIGEKPVDPFDYLQQQ